MTTDLERLIAKLRTAGHGGDLWDAANELERLAREAEGALKRIAALQEAVERAESRARFHSDRADKAEALEADAKRWAWYRKRYGQMPGETETADDWADRQMALEEQHRVALANPKERK
jgi:hypothetical protein